MALHLHKGDAEDVREVRFMDPVGLRYDAKDVLVEYPGLWTRPFEHTEGCRPRDKQVAGLNVKSGGHRSLGAVVWLIRVRQILDANDWRTSRRPVGRLERRAVDEFSGLT
jgi:hypothetical protein